MRNLIHIMCFHLLFFGFIFTGTLCCANGMNETDGVKIKKIAVVLNGGESLEKKYNLQLIQIIAAQLVRHNFEVINTHAFPIAKEAEIQEFTFKDNKNLCKIYDTDAIIVVTPEVTEKDDDGMFCKLGMVIHSWGYDLNGYDLGIAVNKSYSYAGKSCKDTFFKTIKELGYLTGREISLVLDSDFRNFQKLQSINKGYN